MTKFSDVEKRQVRTTNLIVNWENINWDLFKNRGYLVRYDIPRQQKKDREYYSRMHNWYKEQSDFPCYLHTYGPYLYVMYPSSNDVIELQLNGFPLAFAEVDLRDKDIFHAIVKVLLSDYFYNHERFVSNAYFFLRSSSADKSFITGLRIKINQNWRKPEEFAVSDEATRMRKLQPSEMVDDRFRRKNILYGRIYQDGLVFFKQLRHSRIDQRQKNDGIYVEYRDQKHRASITYHSVRSLEALEESRSYLLSHFLANLINHFREYGLSFHQKPLEMQLVPTIHGDKMRSPQLPLSSKPIFIVDDRWKNRESQDSFAEEFSKDANLILCNDLPIFSVRNRSEIQDGDLVLRLQDYDEDDFSPENGLLAGSSDPKNDFYKEFPKVVKQSLNVNPNTEVRRRESGRSNKSQWDTNRYFSYSGPDPKEKELALKLEVCHNQLVLKDIVMYPNNASDRLPQVTMMSGKIFMFGGDLAYFDGNHLHFMTIKNNLNEASILVGDLTGKDLLEQVLIPSVNYSAPNPVIEPEAIDKALKGRFMVSKDYVWEIRENDGRMLYEDLEIRDRFEKLEEEIPTKLFYPRFPLEGNEPFNEDQLRQYASFLDRYVSEAFISYSDLKKYYGKHLKDRDGSILIKNGGFYPLLGIVNDTKFRNYLDKSLGLKFESVRDQTVIPVYQGIWYEPETQQYLVGSKDGRNFDQERGFVLRQIICHEGEVDKYRLFEVLRLDFFPMLEVNFIRFRNYTVYPFPFKLIDIWRDVTIASE
ncbi:MAG: hypothetical protein M1511_02930 [Deltaproteobacteria bacterium]|nr:hypothetical protein [Deltaproteobacteria bacterium]